MFHDLRQFLIEKRGSRTRGHSMLPYVTQRVHTLLIITALSFAAITTRLIFLSSYKPTPQTTTTNNKALPIILDRNHIVLASHLPTESIYLNSSLLVDANHAKNLIQQIFPLANHTYIAENIKKNRSFIWVKRHITPLQKEAALQKGLVGCAFKNDAKRIYPFQNILAHVVGFRDIDNTAYAGMEKYLDQNNVQEDLVLSIDMRVQSIAHHALIKGHKKFKAKGGGVLIMNIKTGEIIAMCSLPDFDPNNSTQRQGPALFNNMLQGAFEFGSIMKVFTLAQGLEEGGLNSTDVLETSKNLYIGKFSITDHHPKPYDLTVAESFIHSSNIGMVQIYKTFGPQKQRDFFEKFGLFETPVVEICECAKGARKDAWSFTRGAIASYGYGIALSPIQFLCSSAALVTGYFVKPTFLKKHKNCADQRVPIELSENTVKTMRKMLYQVTQLGTARKAAFMHYGVGAKTGSACKRSGRVGYDYNKHRAFLLAFFPIEDPQYGMIVMLDEPQGNRSTFFFATAGWTVAPIAQKIIKRVGPLLQLPALKKEEIQRLQEHMYVEGLLRPDTKK